MLRSPRNKNNGDSAIGIAPTPPPKHAAAATAAAEPSKPGNWAVKAASLFVLVFQNTGLVLSMRWSRLATGDMYHPTTAVVMVEASKYAACLGYLAATGGPAQPWRTWRDEVWRRPWEVARVSVPAFLYTMQSNLLFVALSNMDPAFFQVAYQLKILTTAVFSVTMLGRRVTLGQWCALLLLTCGIALVALAQREEELAQSAADLERAKHRNTALGLSIVLVLCLSSGFAGVYFEKVLKTAGSAGLLVRNLQLGSVSLLLACAACAAKAGDAVARDGFFFGYTRWVALTIALQAGGGLLVAVVMRFGDNILKNFALAFSILLSYALSTQLFGVQWSARFGVGALLVIGATACYGYAAPRSAPGSSAKGGGKQQQMMRRTSMLVPGATGTGETIDQTTEAGSTGLAAVKE
jgi:UDP-sugar transporter A1/2/3